MSEEKETGTSPPLHPTRGADMGAPKYQTIKHFREKGDEIVPPVRAS